MITVLDNRQLSCDISILRNVKSTREEFRSAARRIGLHLAVNASHHLPTKSSKIRTPLEETDGFVIDGPVVVVPILRAGLSLLEPFLEIIPSARVGYIGLKRNEETLLPYQYYSNLPTIDSKTTVIVVDPMLATAGSMIEAINSLLAFSPLSILACTIVSAPEGIHRLYSAHPSVHIITAQVDRALNEIGYIVPGLGDMGDRLNGTD